MKINPDVDTYEIFRHYYQSQAYIDYRNMWYECPKKHIVTDFPIHLDIEISRSCNLKCPFCYREYITEKAGMISFEDYKKILNQETSMSIKLNWLGEPTLHPDLVKMVKYAKERGVIDVMINTNGVLLTPRLSKELIDAKIDKIIFSIDTIDSKLYEKYRLPAKFDTVISNLKELLRLKGDKKPIVRVSKVVLEETKNEKVEEYFRDLGVDEFMSTRCIENNPEKKKKGKPTCCPEIWQRLLIDYKGNILPCCSDYEYKCVLGNAFKDNLKTVWHGEKLSKMREIHKQSKAYTLPCCNGCEVTNEY